MLGYLYLVDKATGNYELCHHTEVEAIQNILSTKASLKDIACYHNPLDISEFTHDVPVTVLVHTEEGNTYAHVAITVNQARFMLTHARNGEQLLLFKHDNSRSGTEIKYAIENGDFQNIFVDDEV